MIFWIPPKVETRQRPTERNKEQIVDIANENAFKHYFVKDSK